ncbi:MAG TPA: hypothetical protein VFB16_06040, partial [Bauldia sp.]|nr:hypothetical protein [Bauldia sp.]
LSAFSEFAASQSTIEGHNAYLKPNAVQYISLALHELIAMSLLNGALSVPDGRLLFSSTLEDAEGGEGRDLILSWRETGMAAPYSLADSRFGKALLEEIVPAALGGKASAEYDQPRGFSYWLRVPQSQFF